MELVRHQGSDPTRQQHGKEREPTAQVRSHFSGCSAAARLMALPQAVRGLECLTPT